MCGISGIISRKEPVDLNKFYAMHDSLTHRGPDDSGYWFSDDRKACLGHKRLSIIDLSDGGHQPMISSDGRYVLVYNGEIYNYRELKSKLEKEGVEFHSQSDTEVLLKMWEKYKKDTLLQIRGMFAFAVWDIKTKYLFLARDNFGIKPLYYSVNEDYIAFASEIKAFKEAGIAGTISPKAVGAFLQWGSVPSPLAIYNNLSALLPGECLEWEYGTGKIKKNIFWSYADQYKKSTSLITDYEESVRICRESILDSVKAHLVSDVPIGAFLSGGIDSTAVVSLMRQAGQESISTFSIAPDDKYLNESHYAKLAAEYYGTDHYELPVNKHNFQKFKKKFMAGLDSPTIDGINTWIVSSFAAKNGIKVVTSGTGGDELFYGYDGSFRQLPLLIHTGKKFPTGLRLLLNKISVIPGFAHAIGRKNNKAWSIISYSHNLDKCYSVYRSLFSRNEIAELLNNKDFADEALSPDLVALLPELPLHAHELQKISILETYRYLGSQLLADSDVFSMAHGLELRVPFVDKLLSENVSRIDPKLVYGKRKTPKSLLAEAVGDIPSEIAKRKKQGFTLPIGNWILNEPWTPSSKLLDKKACERINNACREGKVHWSRRWALEVLDNIAKMAGQ